MPRKGYDYHYPSCVCAYVTWRHSLIQERSSRNEISNNEIYIISVTRGHMGKRTHTHTWQQAQSATGLPPIIMPETERLSHGTTHQRDALHEWHKRQSIQNLPPYEQNSCCCLEWLSRGINGTEYIMWKGIKGGNGD